MNELDLPKTFLKKTYFTDRHSKGNRLLPSGGFMMKVTRHPFGFFVITIRNKLEKA